MKKLLIYMKGFRKECVLGPLFKLLEASFELLVPLVMAAVIDTGIGNRDRDYIIRMCVVLVGLGVPAQEFLIHRHLQDFTKGVLMGVGGSFDVLSGMKRRAPALFVKTNTEWLYRILREPSRLKRFWRSNVKFLGEVRKAARK